MSIDLIRPVSWQSEKISAGFFGRAGGVSKGVYESLNCGPGSNDDPAAIGENRARAIAALSHENATLCTLYQVHSDAVLVIREALNDRPKADALVTKTPGLALGILTADCAPVLLADQTAGIIGAAHAGWRGALTGILEETIAAMEALGAWRAQIRAVIGPCISRQSYEVGDEFKARFLACDAAYDQFFTSGKKAQPHFDLQGFTEHRLKGAGLDDIEKISLDTYGLEKRFFSYRRSVHRKEADYGRQLSAICLKT